MALIATSTLGPSNLVKYEYGQAVAHCRESFTVNVPADTGFVIGELVGKVTSTGKYKKCVETATDGSKVVRGIVYRPVSVVANNDRDVLCLTTGPLGLNKDALIIDASYDTDAKRQVLFDALAAMGMKFMSKVSDI